MPCQCHLLYSRPLAFWKRRMTLLILKAVWWINGVFDLFQRLTSPLWHSLQKVRGWHWSRSRTRRTRGWVGFGIGLRSELMPPVILGFTVWYKVARRKKDGCWLEAQPATLASTSKATTNSMNMFKRMAPIPVEQEPLRMPLPTKEREPWPIFQQMHLNSKSARFWSATSYLTHLYSHHWCRSYSNLHMQHHLQETWSCHPMTQSWEGYVGCDGIRQIINCWITH